MRKRRTLLLLIVAVGFVGVLAAILTRDKEPEYQGKKLSEWVKIFDIAETDSITSGDAESQRRQQEAVAALRHFGTNAIPFLLNWIRYETPASKALFYKALDTTMISLNSEWGVSDPREILALNATFAFRALGPVAESAIPELTRMLNDRSKRSGVDAARAAAVVLVLLGDIGLPPLLAVLTNHTQAPDLRCNIAFTIGVYGTNATVSLPILTGLLADTNATVREGASNGVRFIERRAQIERRRKEKRASKTN